MSERSFRRDYQRRVTTAKRRHQLKARKTAAAAVAAGAFALAAPASSSAANLVVGSSADTTGAADCATPTNTDCTLRQAILDANGNTANDTITFDSSITGTITLTSALVVNEGNTNYGLTITGPGASVLSISGNDAYNVLHVRNTGTGLTVSGLTLTHGSGTYAGALLAEKYSNVTLDHVAVTASTATGATDTSGPFDQSLAGGGIANRGQMTITHSVISGNYSTTGSNPGGYYYGGGGINNVGPLTIDSSTITGNTSDHLGGGIFHGQSKYPATLNVSNSTISNNNANDAGGGIASLNKPLYGSSHNSVINSTISGNGAFLGGGFAGKYVSAAEHWTISHSTVAGNGAEYGGGIQLGIVTGSFELLDSTVSGNQAGIGGGLDISKNAMKYQNATQLNNSTIASNHAYGFGGGIYLDTSNGPTPSNLYPLPLFSTIVADNVADVPGPDDVDVQDSSTESFDLSFSLVESAGAVPITQTPAGSSILGVDPQLGALASNGGPTQTQLPAITSPVVDKGSAPGNLTTDQRGDPRTVDTSPANADSGTDIGAVELATGPPAPNGGSAGTKVHGIKKKHKKRKHVLRTKKNAVKIHVTFSSGSPGVTFQCSVDGGPAVPCTSPFSPSVSSAPGKGRIHTVTITAVDSAGNVVGKPRTIRFRIIRVT